MIPDWLGARKAHKVTSRGKILSFGLRVQRV